MKSVTDAEPFDRKDILNLNCAEGMSDVTLLSGISGLSFDSPFLSPLLFFFLPSLLALSVLSFFC